MSRIFLAKVREGSLQPYSKKEEKSDPRRKNDDENENSENELEKEEIKDEL